MVSAMEVSDAKMQLWYECWGVWYAMDAEAFQRWKADQGLPDDPACPPHQTTAEGLRRWYDHAYAPWYARNKPWFAYAVRGMGEREIDGVAL